MTFFQALIISDCLEEMAEKSLTNIEPYSSLSHHEQALLSLNAEKDTYIPPTLTVITLKQIESGDQAIPIALPLSPDAISQLHWQAV